MIFCELLAVIAGCIIGHAFCDAAEYMWRKHNG